MRTHLISLLLLVTVAPVARAQDSSAPGSSVPGSPAAQPSSAQPTGPAPTAPSPPPPDTGASPTDRPSTPEVQPSGQGPAQQVPDVQPSSSNPNAEPGNAAAAPSAPSAPVQTEALDEAKAQQLLTPDPRTQELISGAPLRDPNVRVHIVQRKPFVEQGHGELALYPVAFQTNSKFTEHIGSAASLTWHLHENFGVQVFGQYNWINSESDFNRELINKVREEAQAASSLLLSWGAIGGVEVTPLYGKFAFYQGLLGQFQIVLNGGVGLGSTRHELRPAIGGLTSSYGDTGNKMLGSVGAGLRFQVGERFALRLEVRDLVYTARVDRVNGCDATDLAALNEPIKAGSTDLTGVSVSSSCKVSAFQGTDPKTGESKAYDVPLAERLVEVPTSDVLNNISLYAGVSVVF